MTAEPLQQLDLFANCAPASPGSTPASGCSSVPATSSSRSSPSTPTAATAGHPKAPAPASGTSAGAGSAARRSSAATSTEAFAEQLTISTCTRPRHTHDPELRAMLAIPRPRTRAECLQEARPCPWVSCRHHLLLEVADSDARKDVRPTALRLNRPRELLGLPPGRAVGRRPGLASGAAQHVVERWMADAVEQLQSMRYTCALDVVDQFPDGITDESVGLVLGVTWYAVSAEVARAKNRIRAGLADPDPEDDEP